MDWERRIERLAARARAEETPRVDVTRDVLLALAGDRAQPLTAAERLWMWLAAAASAVAVPTAAVAIMLYSRSAEPLSEIVETISWAIQ